MLVTVHSAEDGMLVNVLSISEPKKGSLAVGEAEATQIIDETDIDDVNYEPPAMSVGMPAIRKIDRHHFAIDRRALSAWLVVVLE